MKYFLSAFIASVVFVAAAGARADDTGTPPGPPGMAIMQQTREKVDQLHAQARVSMLNALSPAHRTLLAQVVGQLVIAQSPDLAAAAKQIDAQLSPAESKSVLSISSSTAQQVQQVLEAARQQMQQSMQGGYGQGSYGQGGYGHRPYGMRGGMNGLSSSDDTAQTDAGTALLSMAGRTLNAGTSASFGGAMQNTTR